MEDRSFGFQDGLLEGDCVREVVNDVDRNAVVIENMNLKSADMMIEFAVNDDLNNEMLVQIEHSGYTRCYTVLSNCMRKLRRYFLLLIASLMYKKSLRR